jgi:hypothetical protein
MGTGAHRDAVILEDLLRNGQRPNTLGQVVT